MDWENTGQNNASQNTPTISTTSSPGLDTMKKLMAQIRSLKENKKEWVTKIGVKAMEREICEKKHEEQIDLELQGLKKGWDEVAEKIRCLEEVLQMMKDDLVDLEALGKPQESPGENDKLNPKKHKKKGESEAEAEMESESEEGSDYEDNQQLNIPKESPNYNTGDSAKQFLDEFESDMPSLLGPKKFKQLCKRYLIVLTKCLVTKKALKAEFEKEGLEHPTWLQCENLFLRVATTEDQHTFELCNILMMGRLEGETYQQFALWMLHDINLYGIQDENSMVIDLIRAGLHDEAKNNLDAKLERKNK